MNLVRVPVVVRDKQGHALGQLAQRRFSTHRSRQATVPFAIRLEGSAVPRPAAPAATHEEIPSEPAAAGSKLVVPTRFVAFVFDDVHLNSGDLINVRVAALKHVERGIRPQDRVALLTLSGKSSLEFTDDMARFRDALMKIQPQPPHSHFPPATFFAADQWMNRDNQQALNMQTW